MNAQISMREFTTSNGYGMATVSHRQDRQNRASRHARPRVCRRTHARWFELPSKKPIRHAGMFNKPAPGGAGRRPTTSPEHRPLQPVHAAAEAGRARDAPRMRLLELLPLAPSAAEMCRLTPRVREADAAGQLRRRGSPSWRARGGVLVAEQRGAAATIGAPRWGTSAYSDRHAQRAGRARQRLVGGCAGCTPRRAAARPRAPPAVAGARRRRRSRRPPRAAPRTSPAAAAALIDAVVDLAHGMRRPRCAADPAIAVRTASAAAPTPACRACTSRARRRATSAARAGP